MKKSIKSIFVLVCICASVSLLLALTNYITDPIIKGNEQKNANAALIATDAHRAGFDDAIVLSEAGNVTEGSAIGAAVYAAIAAGAMSHPGEIKKFTDGKEKVFVPDPEGMKKFEKAYETYRKLAYAINSIEQ